MTLSRRRLLQLLGISSTTLALPHMPEVPSHDAPASDAPAPEPMPALCVATRLEVFIRSRGIKPSLLAHEAGYARALVFDVRFGRALPTLALVAALTIAARRFTHEYTTPADLFEQDVLASAMRRCNPATLERHQRAQIIAAFGRRTARRALDGVR